MILIIVDTIIMVDMSLIVVVEGLESEPLTGASRTHGPVLDSEDTDKKRN